jgi:hypothetical protein
MLLELMSQTSNVANPGVRTKDRNCLALPGGAMMFGMDAVSRTLLTVSV